MPRYCLMWLTYNDLYEVRLMKAYRNDSDKIEKAHKQDLEYFCGRSTFYPYEC